MSSGINIHEQFMQRCLQLAEQGAGHVAPNPMVGAVLVHEGKIIGEGYHQKYGEAHAEVNCIHQAAQNGRVNLISQSTLYVSLEPCAHYGKTPPCADLIIKNKIPKVVIGCRDPFTEVDGKGIEKLETAEIEVTIGILEKECKELNKRFITFHTKKRPYIILKWAQTANKKIAALALNSDQKLNNSAKGGDSAMVASPKGGGREGASRLLISNEYSNRLVHKWRSEEASILIGTNTALMDDPQLTTKLWSGPSPIRLVIDMDLRLPSSLKIFNNDAPTIIFNKIKHEEEGSLQYYQVTEDVSLVHQITNALYQLNIQSVLVEGGARLLQSFIDEGMWDEARIISNEQLAIGNGLAAPDLKNASKIEEQNILSDRIEFYKQSEG